MNNILIAKSIATLELASALPLYGIYSAPIRFYGADNYWTLLSLGSNLLGLCFIVLPLFAVIGIYRGWRVSYACMGLYPIVAFMLGATPVPFLTHLYTNDLLLNTVFIGIINALALSAVIWLFILSKRHSNNLLNQTGAYNAPPG